jgi:hypothetical protein
VKTAFWTETLSEAAPVSLLTNLVSLWPRRIDTGRANRAEPCQSAEASAEDEPTWEDAEWQ